jgi:Domain of unknown function (DUF929)
MGKASRTKVDSSRREKIAAQRAAARRSEQRRRILIAGGSVLAVIIIIVGFIVFKANKTATPTATSSSTLSGTALASVVSKTTTVPASALNSVGSGTVSVKPQTISGTALTSGGKPEMLYMGAEYCPYCAAERWAMVVALSRFGTFSGLATIHSAAADGAGNNEPYPNTPTWTFLNAKFTSQYLAFSTVEMQTNVPDKTTGTYTNLQKPTAAQTALIDKYDAAPYVSAADAGSIPFVDFGNKYMSVGASYTPQVLAGLSWSQVAADLSNPSSAAAKGVDGTANYMTAAICKLTANQPASACTSTVQSLESQL